MPRSIPAWAIALVLLVVTVAVYAPALRGGMIWDDDDHITAPHLRSFEGLRRIWVEPGVTQQYYPILHTAFWLEHRLWGDQVLFYHLVNVLLHWLSACVLAWILMRLGAPGPWLAAALFALHPVAVESVAWITEQKNTLSTVLYLLAALLFLRFSDSRRPRHYLAASALFVVAILAKSNTVTLPVALALVCWWRYGAVRWRQDIVPLTPWAVAGVAMGLTTAWLERAMVGASGSEWTMSLAERILVAGRALWFYAGKLVWPHPLMFMYPRWELDPGAAWQYLFPLAAVLALAALAVWRRRWPATVTCVAIYLVGLFPALGFFDVYAFRYSFVADHFQYLASVAMFPLLATLLLGATRHFSPRIRIAVALSAIGVLSGLTWRQSLTYRDAHTHYRTILALNPRSWMAYNNLGALLLNDGATDEGIRLLREGLRYKDAPELNRNLADGLTQSGQLVEAVAHYERTLTLDASSAVTENSLGEVLRRLGRVEEALPHLERATALDPEFAAAFSNLGATLIDLGRAPESIAPLQQAVSKQPDFAAAFGNLGLAWALLENWPEANRAFETSLALRPGSALVESNFADALLRQGRVAEAAEHYRRALRIDPLLAEAENGLGAALATGGELAAARLHFERALELRPGYRSARENLDRLLGRPSS